MRFCGERCHRAASPPATCRCWCSGMFHGPDGGIARDAYVAQMGAPPTTEPAPDATAEADARHRGAMFAARAAHDRRRRLAPNHFERVERRRRRGARGPRKPKSDQLVLPIGDRA